MWKNVKKDVFICVSESLCYIHWKFSSIQLFSCVWLFATPWITVLQASLSITNSRGLLKLMSTESMMPYNHPLSSPYPLAISLSQHQGKHLFQWEFFPSGGQSIGVSSSASVLPKNIQDWFHLGLTGLIFLQSKGLSRVFSNTTVQKHQFLSVQLSLWSNFHTHAWLLEKP